MSDANSQVHPELSVTDPRFGERGQHTIGIYKDDLGWLAPEQRFTVPECGVYSIDIDALEVASPDGPQLVIVPNAGDDTFHAIEARLKRGEYDRDLPDDGVLVFHVDRSRRDGFLADPAWLVDDPIWNYSRFDSASWIPGEVFTNESAELSVSVDHGLDDGFGITVSVRSDWHGDADCSGEVDAGDLVTMIRDLTAGAFAAPGNGDCDRNGQVGESDLGCIAAQVNAGQNRRPVARDDETNLYYGFRTVFTVLENDFDPDETDALRISAILSTPTNGVAEIVSDGQLIFYENFDQEAGAREAIRYEITDGRGGRDEATVFVDILEPSP